MRTFKDVLAHYNNLGVCVKFILVWIALSDDQYSEQENNFVNEIFPDSTDNVDTNTLKQIINNKNVTDFVLACSLMKNLLNDEQKISLAELSIGVAVADGRLSISENLILRFIVDFIGLTPSKFEKIYEECVGRKFRLPNDISSHAFWERYVNEKSDYKYYNDQYSSTKNKGNVEFYSNEYINSLAILGLTADATIEEIKTAYRRLVKIHHPDKFESLGRDAVETANKTMQRIQSAYDYLLQQ
jgi:DnaJ-domain-containing protein 1